MDYKTAIALSLPIGLGLAAVGSALGLGKAISSAMESMARQPELQPKIFLAMIVGCAFIEAITIYVFALALMKL